MLDEESFKKRFSWAPEDTPPRGPRSRRWTAEETATLRALFPVHGTRWAGWGEALPERSVSAIDRKARDLGIKSPLRGPVVPWTERENEVLRRLYPLYGRAWDGWVDALPGRSIDAIGLRAHRIGACCREAAAPWSEAEDSLLAEHYPTHGAAWDGWAEVLPGRTRGALWNRAHALGISKGGPKGKGRRGRRR